MEEFKSNAEFLAAARAFVKKVKADGNEKLAESLNRGFSCLDGQTIGWSHLMDALEEIIFLHGPTLPPEDLGELKRFHSTVDSLVRRT